MTVIIWIAIAVILAIGLAGVGLFLVGIERGYLEDLGSAEDEPTEKENPQGHATIVRS
ncbi:MAG TPA: hypothetical protein VK419_15555 [Bryobacteraceae bacterium]|nr:hypothetical protein [Bryobacteraceae bacterium]